MPAHVHVHIDDAEDSAFEWDAPDDAELDAVLVVGHEGMVAHPVTPLENEGLPIIIRFVSKGMAWEPTTPAARKAFEGIPDKEEPVKSAKSEEKVPRRLQAVTTKRKHMLARVTEQPIALPAECKSCGAGSLSEREWWLDTGTYEEFYGRVYYCNVCMTEIAELCGFLGPTKRIKLETELKEANVKVRELEESLAALSTLGIDVGALSGFVSSHHVSLEGEEGKLDVLIARAAIASEQIDEQRSLNLSDPKPGRKPKLSLT